MDALKEATNLIFNAQKILIFMPKNPCVDALASAFSFWYVLDKKDKTVDCLPRQLPQNYHTLFPQELIPKDFVISIQGKEVTELYYEKENQALKIYLTLKDGKIEKEDIHFNSLQRFADTSPDLLITIGVERLELIGEFYEKNFKMFWETPIINVDNQAANNGFGHINLVVQSSPLSAISKDLIKEIDEQALSREVKTWLLAGAIEYSQRTQETAFPPEAMFGLSEENINFKKLTGFFLQDRNQVNPAYKKLLDTILTRLEIKRDKQIPTAIITKKDFSQAQATPKDLGFALKHLTQKMFTFSCFLLLWEGLGSGSHTRGVFYSRNQLLREKLIKCLGGQEKGPAVVFNHCSNSAETVKENILTLLC